jgi:DNA-directed RNA polymerase subunit beta
MRDEDDDLLRAAEELGIDLSGVRAGGDGEEPAADEGTETVDATDAVAPEDDETIAAEIPTPDVVADIDLDADVPVDLPVDEN